MVYYDFADFLSRIDPFQSYSIQKVTGGVVNFTARASKSPANPGEEGRFRDHKSIILKQAPPYIAGIGPEAEISQDRQVDLC